MFDRTSPVKVVILYLIAVLFVIFNLSNIKIAGVSSLTPMFDLMIVFYFSIFCPVFPVWFVFLLGMWSDSLTGAPLGATSLCYIVLIKSLLLLNSKTMAMDNFKQIWKQFAFFSAAFLLMKWTILSIADGTTYSLWSPLLQFIISGVLYILMHRFFDYLKLKLLEN
jgi:hypothetical protein